MKRTTRKRVTLETERVVVISRQTGLKGWCKECSAEIDLIGLEEAATISGLSQMTIFHHVESHQLHFVETLDGALLICLSSLIRNSNGSESEPSPE